jgi:hypothetical protein
MEKKEWSLVISIGSIRYKVSGFKEIEDQIKSLQKAIAQSRQNQAKILERLDRLEILLQN